MADSTEPPTWPERAEPSMLAYSALFGITYIAGAVAVGMLLKLAPRHNSGSSFGHLVVLCAALLTGWVFVRRHKRLFTPGENVRLVCFCAVWVLAMEALALVAYAPRLNALPPGVIAGILFFTVAVDVLIVWAVFRFAVRRMMQRRVSGHAPSNKMSSRTHRLGQALLIFVVGLIVLAAASHVMPDLVHPTREPRTVIFLVVGSAGIVCVLAGLALAVRAALFRPKT